jgi:signal transduction histidine kinase
VRFADLKVQVQKMRLAVAVLLGMGLWFGTVMGQTPSTPDSPTVHTITQAEAVLEPEGLPPQRVQVNLRHRWDSAFPGRGGRARYTLSLPVSTLLGGQTLGLYLERAGNQASVKLNGVQLQQWGEPGSTVFDSSKFSRVLALPRPLLEGAGPQLVEIEIHAQASRGAGLSPVVVGPFAAVLALQERQQFWTHGPAAAYAACLLLMGGLAAGLWWRQRESLFGYFSVAALCGAVRPLDQWLQNTPLPWPLWGALLALAYGLQLGLMARFVLLALDRHIVWLVRSIQIVLGSMAVLVALSFGLGVPALWTLALVMLELVGLACFGVVLQEAWRRRRLEAWWLLAAGGMTLLAGTHDLFRVRMGLWGGSTLALTPHAMFVFVLFLAALVVSRFSRTSEAYRVLNSQLTERVAEKEQLLRDTFESLRQEQHERTVLGERQRIMREIHDGIGSQLVGLLSLVHQEQVQPLVLEEQVRHALDEMRMAVDSLQPMQSDLTAVLATLRYRLQPRLQAAGIEVQWDVDSLPPIPGLEPPQILQVQRILLEGFTNVIKHAKASRVVMQARWQTEPQPAVWLQLIDNGVGLSAPALELPGLGLPSMRARAKALGATLTLSSGDAGGAILNIVWPVAQGEI